MVNEIQYPWFVWSYKRGTITYKFKQDAIEEYNRRKANLESLNSDEPLLFGKVFKEHQEEWDAGRF